MIKSFRQWRESNTQMGGANPTMTSTSTAPSLDPATNVGQARHDYKEMDPRMLMFGANLAKAFGEIEAKKPGYTRRIIGIIANGLDRFTEIPKDDITLLKNKLKLVVNQLPTGTVA